MKRISTLVGFLMIALLHGSHGVIFHSRDIQIEIKGGLIVLKPAAVVVIKIKAHPILIAYLRSLRGSADQAILDWQLSSKFLPPGFGGDSLSFLNVEWTQVFREKDVKFIPLKDEANDNISVLKCRDVIEIIAPTDLFRNIRIFHESDPFFGSWVENLHMQNAFCNSLVAFRRASPIPHRIYAFGEEVLCLIVTDRIEFTRNADCITEFSDLRESHLQLLNQHMVTMRTEGQYVIFDCGDGFKYIAQSGSRADPNRYGGFIFEDRAKCKAWNLFGGKAKNCDTSEYISDSLIGDKYLAKAFAISVCADVISYKSSFSFLSKSVVEKSAKIRLEAGVVHEMSKLDLVKSAENPPGGKVIQGFLVQTSEVYKNGELGVRLSFESGKVVLKTLFIHKNLGSSVRCTLLLPFTSEEVATLALAALIARNVLVEIFKHANLVQDGVCIEPKMILSTHTPSDNLVWKECDLPEIGVAKYTVWSATQDYMKSIKCESIIERMERLQLAISQPAHTFIRTIASILHYSSFRLAGMHEQPYLRSYGYVCENSFPQTERIPSVFNRDKLCAEVLSNSDESRCFTDKIAYIQMSPDLKEFRFPEGVNKILHVRPDKSVLAVYRCNKSNIPLPPSSMIDYFFGEPIGSLFEHPKSPHEY